jgi:hypothetical protein
MTKSNCLCIILIAQRRLGGQIKWWPGWNKGWKSWSDNPWDHFYLELSNGTCLHFSAENKNLLWWQQLWFKEKLVRNRSS